MAFSTAVCLHVGAPAVAPGRLGDELQTQMVGISRLARGRLAASHVWAPPPRPSPTPTPTEPQRRACLSVTLLTLASLVCWWRPTIGLISSHSPPGSPSGLRAPGEKGWGCLVGMSVWKQPCFEKVMLLPLSGTDFVIRSNIAPLNGALSVYICTFIARHLGIEPSFLH